MRRQPLPFAALLASGILSLAPARADEGMWLFTSPPVKLLKERHGFEPDAGWLEHVQKSSVRFPRGSGSFVSADGLVMTNHHVGRDALAKLSTRDRNIARDGYSARARADELKCPDLDLLSLQSIEDVTARVNGAVKPGMSDAEADKARRAVVATIEKESTDKTGLKSDVVTLYQGGQYHLYRSKRYTDVRLVFAPEADAAHFGGDPDNFEFPRFCLDCAFFRAYEDGRPARVAHHLGWCVAGAKADELVLVSGHPGRTSRLNTVAHLEHFRDQAYPLTLALLRRQEVMYKTFSERGAENARRATSEYLGVQNGRKLYVGMLDGLQDPAALRQKRADEMALRAAVDADAELKKAYGDAWEQVTASVRVMEREHRTHLLLEGRARGLSAGAAFNSQLFGIARALARHADEKEKPNTERLREFRESALPQLKQQLFSEAPIYEDLETAKLADSLALLAETRGADDALVRAVLDGGPPSARAAALVRGTRLRDVAARRALFDGGRAAVEATDDPMIRLARLVDPEARAARKRWEEGVEEPQRQAYAKISRAAFALRGAGQYPDATFTLRLAFGTVKGYREGGREVAPFTTVGGLFQRAEGHAGEAPFRLPGRWLERRGRIDAATPFNFVCTADIIGGNSGSPVVNRRGEVVGLIFDGNIQSLSADFRYSDEQARAVAVDARGIVAALRQIYDAGGLADEIAPRP
jgi:hypothetical protein